MYFKMFHNFISFLNRWICYRLDLLSVQSVHENIQVHTCINTIALPVT